MHQVSREREAGDHGWRGGVLFTGAPGAGVSVRLSRRPALRVHAEGESSSGMSAQAPLWMRAPKQANGK